MMQLPIGNASLAALTLEYVHALLRWQRPEEFYINYIILIFG